jgi:hypothetical protein
MKILHINNFEYPDYQSDLLMHGGRTIFGDQYIDSSKATYLYDSFEESKLGTLYGFGFCFSRRLNDIDIDRENLLEKIKDRYFDFIFFGSIHRNRTYLDEVLKIYPKERIVFIDGEDEPDRIIWDLTERGLYFKRELIYDNKNLHPIGFGIPEELIVDDKYKKSKLISDLSMAEIGYSFGPNQEKEYLDNFRKSFFSRTIKKAGWDSFRNYEIVASGSLPLYKDYDNIPKLTMNHWDKDLLRESFDLFWKFDLSDHRRSSSPGLEQYDNLRVEFLKVARQKLTTKSILNNILEKL